MYSMRQTDRRTMINDLITLALGIMAGICIVLSAQYYLSGSCPDPGTAPILYRLDGTMKRTP